MLKNKTINEKTLSNTLFIFAITLMGIFLRLQYYRTSDFVINDGGMFMTMIVDLEKNGFILPKFTSYNFSQIPYAYPPLSFYSGAVLNQFLHINLITLFRLYPLFYNILSIPAIYFMAREISRNNRQSMLATAFYAILLPGFEWLISGGGLTRSPAHTLFIVAFTLYLAFVRTKKRKFLFWSIITASLMTLHHIEYCWMLVFSMVLFSVIHLKFLESLKIGLIYLIGSAILTAPYWAVVMANHGITPIISAFTAGEFNFVATFARLLILVFTEETLISFINVLAIIGCLYCVFTRRYSVLIWLVLIGFLNPRSANRSLVFPVVLLAAMAVDELICPALDNLWRKTRETMEENPTGRKSWRDRPQIYSIIFMAFSIGFPFFLGFLNTLGVHPVLSMLPQADLDAMTWIKQNTEKSATFIVLNPSIEWHMDKMGEWFPTLTERKSLTTIQGTEWLPDGAFEANKELYDEFKKCADIGETCLTEWTEKNQVKFDYLVVSRFRGAYTPLDSGLSYFNQTVLDSGKYSQVYTNDMVTVFKTK